LSIKTYHSTPVSTRRGGSGNHRAPCRKIGASGIEGDGYVEFEMDNTKFSLFERSKLPELIGREGGNPPCGEIGFLIEDVDGEAERFERARCRDPQRTDGPAMA
jgi:hypothetical protein